MPEKRHIPRNYPSRLQSEFTAKQDSYMEMARIDQNLRAIRIQEAQWRATNAELKKIRRAERG